MTSEKSNGRFWASDIAILIYLALTTMIAHFLTCGNYGYVLDEFYVIDCSKHLSFGFVDIPPVTPTLMVLVTSVLGTSLGAIRLIPSILSGLMVIIVGLMAKQLGGGKFAVFLAGLSALMVPVWMTICCWYDYDPFDQFMVVVFCWTFLNLIRTSNGKRWLFIGAVAGIGLLVKTSIVFFILALMVAVLLTKYRKQFVTPWPWLGGLVALVIILPSIVWQMQHGFPAVQFWQNYSKAVDTNPLGYLIMQIVVTGFTLLPVWLTGLYYFLFHRDGKQYRLLAIAFLLMFAFFIVIRPNVYMLTPAFATLLAGGAVQIETFFERKRRKLLQYAYILLILLLGLIQSPIYMPILPINGLLKYYEAAGGIMGTKSVKFAKESYVELPNYIYNRLEWDILADDVYGVYQSLPENERSDTGILTRYYAWAGCVNLFDGPKGLPEVSCGHVNYYFFSLNNLNKKTWIDIGESPEYLAKAFSEVTLAKISKTKYRLPRETPIYICRGRKLTDEQFKEYVKKFE